MLEMDRCWRCYWSMACHKETSIQLTSFIAFVTLILILILIYDSRSGSSLNARKPTMATMSVTMIANVNTGGF